MHAEDRIDAECNGDLAGMFKLDEQSKKAGIYDAGKGPMIIAANTCRQCHDASYTVEKYMPGTGSTAAGLFIRTHTFNKDQARPRALTATGEAALRNPKNWPARPASAGMPAG